jgi:TorA maturation chaperone TorD
VSERHKQRRNLLKRLEEMNINGLFDRDEEGVIEELATEYASLFCVPGQSSPPYESVAREKRLLGDVASEVRDFYRRCGLKPKKNFMPDHLGLELEAMAHLKEKEAEYRKRRKKEEAERMVELQQKFLSEHLLQWVPQFFERIEGVAEHPFYSQMARLAREFIESEDVS